MKLISPQFILTAITVLSAPSVFGATPAGWTTDAHSSATIKFNAADAFTVQAPNNVHAHVERPITESSPLRISASMKSPEVADWAPSLFIYWSPGTWVRIAYISAHEIYHVNGPGVYGIISSETEGATSYRLTTTASSDWTYNPDNGGLDKAPADSIWHNVGLVLTDDAVHFQARDDGGTWQTNRSLPRPSAMAGPPVKFIVGKGYYEKEKYPAPDLDNDYPDAGPVTIAQVRDLKIESVSASELTHAEQASEQYRDTYGEAELALPGDPTFESVARHWPPLLYPRDALGVPNHPEEFTVLPNGVIGAWPTQLLYPDNYEVRRAWFNVGSGQRFGGETTVSRSLEDHWLPILTCGYQHEGLQYNQTMAAWSEGMSPDAPLIGLLQMTVTNPTAKATTASLAFYSEHEKKNLLHWEPQAIPAGGRHSVWLQVTFPQGSNQPITASKIDEADYTRKLSEVKDTWKKLISQGMQIDVPEERIMNAWRAWHVWMFTDVDKIKGHLEFHDGGGGFYELVYGFSAARAAELADMLGRPQEARAWIQAMLNMVDKDGKLIVNFGLPDHGSVLSAAAHHYRYTGDKEWLKSVAPTLVKMSQWARDARARARAETPTTSPVYGMILERPYCDHPAPAYYLISDILLAGGLQDVASVLPSIGLQQDSQWIENEARAYTADLQKVVEKSIFKIDGQELLPLFPETRELLRASGWMASDYYSLLSTCLLERGGEVIPANSRYSRMITDALEKRGGLLMGVSRFWGGIDHAYAAGYWADRLRNGEPEKALLGLYASMAYGMSRDTFSSVEVTFARDGKNFPTLPHNFSNLEQIRLVKNLLVDETTDTLILGSGIARPWLTDGNHVEVTNAQTQWGSVGYRMESIADKGAINIKVNAPTKSPSGGIKIFFRHPNSSSIIDVKSDGARVTSTGPDYIVIIPQSAEFTIQAIF